MSISIFSKEIHELSNKLKKNGISLFTAPKGFGKGLKFVNDGIDSLEKAKKLSPDEQKREDKRKEVV